MRVITVVGLFLCSMLPVRFVVAQERGKAPLFSTTVDTVRTPWTGEKFVNDPADFRFAIIGDCHVGARANGFASAVEKLNLLRPEFVISVGDLIGGGTHSSTALTEQWGGLGGISVECRGGR